MPNRTKSQRTHKKHRIDINLLAWNKFPLEMVGTVVKTQSSPESALLKKSSKKKEPKNKNKKSAHSM